ncbi:polysaccharide pyruvyl transferase family protein [Nodularia spumigena]|jgi:succinoglycan biosynthesis protein ExoV|uniref:Exopolysaccharide glucosyl ketal-pyruvate-transferase n=1 Tax=Nodularia spumigena UHCC 0039 TaxID=1914872 RepID=A0A2S0Q6V3_NODSP|nr:polysaccharide pyruvyl transferase family protein [Nodularia spumigena]AVZ30124.1 exopolysaccharide glucosyl ketal-pyruvate-transferase [Nodularia spumigena UHCC 0039]
MKLFYYEPGNNFGDQLNPWLWQKLIPGILDNDETNTFVGIGTLFNDLLPMRTQNARLRVIFSTGVGYGKGLPPLDDSYKIYCLRGPLSAQSLGVSEKLAVTDGAILIRNFFQPENQKKVYKFSYMPHHRLAGENWRLICDSLGFGYIDPCWSIEKVLSCMSQTEVLLAEAMHGAIIADALRIPWIPIKTDSTILEFKWQDWCKSIGVEYKPSYIKPLKYPNKKRDILTPIRKARDWLKLQEFKSEFLQITKTAPPSLSSDKSIENLTEEMNARLEEFKQDVSQGIYA